MTYINKVVSSVLIKQHFYNYWIYKNFLWEATEEQIKVAIHVTIHVGSACLHAFVRESQYER